MPTFLNLFEYDSTTTDAEGIVSFQQVRFLCDFDDIQKDDCFDAININLNITGWDIKGEHVKDSWGYISSTFMGTSSK